MLSRGQLEIRRIVKSFLEEYESLQKTDADYEEKLDRLCFKVRDAFCSNETIRKDEVTSQRLGASQYSRNYRDWLWRTGKIEEIKDIFLDNPTDIDFSMREIVYRPDGKLEPACKGGVKWESTISCLFGLAQGKPLRSGNWYSTYYDAIDLWVEGSGGHHRLLSHILYGSDKINPDTITLIRNESVDTVLNESLLQFDKLFDTVSLDREQCISLAFDLDLLSREELGKIKTFFNNVSEDEKITIVRCLKAMMRFGHRYISNNFLMSKREVTINAMYDLLKDIRTIRSRPLWHRRLLVLKQKLLGLRAVDPITCSVLHLATWDRPYWNDDRLNEKGLLYYLPGLHQALSSLLK